MKNILILIFSIFILSSCAHLKGGGASTDYSVTGKVALGSTPLPGVDVFAYRAQSMLGFKTPDYTAKTDEKGTYSFQCSKEGAYYITAGTKSNGADHYAFYGRNPLYVTKAGVTDVNLKLQEIRHEVKFEPADKTSIECTLTEDGEPLSGAIVYVTTDLNQGLQTMGLVQSSLSNSEGKSQVALDKGTYYLTARKRVNDMFGPMGEGDLIGFFHKNPIVLKDTGNYSVSIELVAIPKNIDTNSEKSASVTSITGIVRDENEKLAEGVWVCAYKDPQMFGKPLHLSEKTDATGAFTLILPKGDKYFIAARNTLGGPPSPGDLFGYYNDTLDHSVDIKTGDTIPNIAITVREMW